MSTIQRIQTGPRMSKIVIHSGVVYLSGQTASGGEFASGNITEQTQAVLAKIDNLLAEAGSDKTRILSTTIYLKTMEDFATMNVAWESWINPEHTPARATVQALMASPDLRVEMSVVAACD
ncbi:putative translation initiation inhibitor, yjgF family [Pseudomonas sp. GM33]|uniref:RidA family protein n=1 Tax=unclassified Pseudomonas TaxID=196821 RepID=UPI00026FE9A8|nr:MULTISPECIES: RidA family protein [unclassified Pseudomonas]EJM34459.1 putative translation initiation inhibitor, yjgF family [Pseudomonas sp. GM33]EJM53603.1 putative translation initiation inhibitor, yjgF family [Pseudomonas sp. GM49]